MAVVASAAAASVEVAQVAVEMAVVAWLAATEVLVGVSEADGSVADGLAGGTPCETCWGSCKESSQPCMSESATSGEPVRATMKRADVVSCLDDVSSSGAVSLAPGCW